MIYMITPILGFYPYLFFIYDFKGAIRSVSSSAIKFFINSKSILSSLVGSWIILFLIFPRGIKGELEKEKLLILKNFLQNSYKYLLEFYLLV